MRIIFTMNFNSFLDLKDLWQGYELSGLVFKSLRTGEKLVNLARQEQKIRDESGIKEWTLHLTRHIITSFGGERGLSGTTLSGNLGHKDLNTINTYLTNDNLKASKKVDEILKELRE